MRKKGDEDSNSQISAIHSSLPFNHALINQASAFDGIQKALRTIAPFKIYGHKVCTYTVHENAYIYVFVYCVCGLSECRNSSIALILSIFRLAFVIHPSLLFL